MTIVKIGSRGVGRLYGGVDCVAGVDWVARGCGAEAAAAESEACGRVGGSGVSVVGAEPGVSRVEALGRQRTL